MDEKILGLKPDSRHSFSSLVVLMVASHPMALSVVPMAPKRLISASV